MQNLEKPNIEWYKINNLKSLKNITTIMQYFLCSKKYTVCKQKLKRDKSIKRTE